MLFFFAEEEEESHCKCWSNATKSLFSTEDVKLLLSYPARAVGGAAAAAAAGGLMLAALRESIATTGCPPYSVLHVGPQLS